MATAKQAAERASLSTSAGMDAREVFADEAVASLLAGWVAPSGLSTPRTTAFLRWRYGLEQLRYRVMTRHGDPQEGCAIFRLRRRGKAVEAVVCDVLVPRGAASLERALTRAIARRTEADYLLRIDQRPLTLDPFVRVPRIGPVLVCRMLDGSPAPPLASWSLTMGDIELF